MNRIEELGNGSDLEEIFSLPRVMLFKNSTRCGISRRAYGELVRFAQESADDVKIYIVDVIQERTISEQITERTGVHHQSPQAIYLEDGKAVWNTSHFEITMENMSKAIEKKG
jgi:bacillithiol system protein YtxJ